MMGKSEKCYQREAIPPPATTEEVAALRNLAGEIMHRCGVRGMSKEHGALQDWVEAALRRAHSEGQQEERAQFLSAIAEALRSAESRGREEGKREGLEQAAQIIEAQSSLADYRDMAALVRAALSPPEPAQRREP